MQHYLFHVVISQVHDMLQESKFVNTYFAMFEVSSSIQYCCCHTEYLHIQLKPIFHQNAKYLASGTFASSNAKNSTSASPNARIPTCWYILRKYFAFLPDAKPKSCQWNIGCVGCQRNIFARACTFHVFFVDLSQKLHIWFYLYSKLIYFCRTNF